MMKLITGHSGLRYSVNIENANKHRIREMIADAKELRNDGWLEPGTGTSLFFYMDINPIVFRENR